MAKVEFHKRGFDSAMQTKLQQECHAAGLIWRDWENNPILNREMQMGLAAAKKLVPAQLHQFLECEVEPFTYEITIFMHVGVSEDVKYCHCSECT